MKRSTSMDVLHLVWSLETGGLERVVLDLTARSEGAGLRTAVLCMGLLGSMGEAARRDGVNVQLLGADISHVRRFGKMIATLRELSPAVLHTHNVQAHIHGTLAARAAGIRIVVNTKHGCQHPESWRARALSKLATTLSDRMVAVSTDVARATVRVEGVPAGKITVIHNGIDTTRYTPVRNPVTTNHRAVCVARLATIKDHATLLRAARIVVDTVPTFHLDVVGDGVERTNLEHLAVQLGIGSHVTFHGDQPQVYPLLQRSGCFVLSSLSEGISLTILEAMATGLAVVATDVGGNPEVVENGVTGVLVPKAQPVALASALLRILSDPVLQHRLGEAGRSRVVERFDLNTCSDRYIALYDALRTQRTITGRSHPQPRRLDALKPPRD